MSKANINNKIMNKIHNKIRMIKYKMLMKRK